jgi:hypothetical protein
VLGGDQQLAAKGGFAGAAAQGLLGADFGHPGVVVDFREVGQHQIARAAVEGFRIGEKVTYRLIGEVSGAAHDALFHVPGIGADLKRLHVVIRFQDQAIAIAEVLFHQFRHVTEIGHQREFQALGAKGEAQRIDGVVGDAKGRDFDIADAESVARFDEFDVLEAARVTFGKITQGFGVGFGAEVNGSAPGGQQRGQAADVIGVFVGDDDAVEAVNRIRESGQAPQRFALSQARVHQQARPGSLQQGAIARTARRENAHAKADGFSFRIPDLRCAAATNTKNSRPHASWQKCRARVNAISTPITRKSDARWGPGSCGQNSRRTKPQQS